MFWYWCLVVALSVVALWQALWRAVTNDEARGWEERYKRMARKLETLDAEAVRTEAVRKARDAERLAWFTATRAFQANRALSRGMQRMARKVARWRKEADDRRELEARVMAAVKVLEELSTEVDIEMSFDADKFPTVRNRAEALKHWRDCFDATLLGSSRKEEPK